jgi:hypothetical protein
MFVVDPVAAEDNSAFVLVLRFLQLGMFDHAQVEERTKMCMDTSFVQLLFGFLLDIPVLSNKSFIPRASAVVCLAQFIPFVVDGSHCSRIGFPLFPRHWFGN